MPRGPRQAERPPSAWLAGRQWRLPPSSMFRSILASSWTARSARRVPPRSRLRGRRAHARWRPWSGRWQPLGHRSGGVLRSLRRLCVLSSGQRHCGARWWRRRSSGPSAPAGRGFAVRRRPARQPALLGAPPVGWQLRVPLRAPAEFLLHARPCFLFASLPLSPSLLLVQLALMAHVLVARGSPCRLLHCSGDPLHCFVRDGRLGIHAASFLQLLRRIVRPSVRPIHVARGLIRAPVRRMPRRPRGIRSKRPGPQSVDP